jgi:type IX secretion system substrate protein
MKQTILFCLFSIFSFQLFSQCVPNEIYRDSAVGVYPPPYDETTNPDGGITESACIGSGYDFVFTFKIPESFLFNNILVDLYSITIAETGAVGGLPVGLTYGCNPDSCIFTPADTLACLHIYGTATSDNTVGEYPLTISTMISTSLGVLPITFPSPVIPGGDGEYILTLHEEGNPDCTIAGTNDYITKNIRVTNWPNPFSTSTRIEVNSKVNEQLDFRVFDLLGNIVHQRNVEIFEGENNFDFDGTHLANGIYTFSLSNKLGTITRKIVVSR